MGMDNPKVRLEVTVDTTDTENVNTRFESINNLISGLARKIEKGAEDGAEQLAYHIQDLEKQYLVLNGNYLHGDLYNSIETEGGSLEYIIGSNLDGYSPNVIEYGRGAVYPVHAQFLHYVDERAGKEIFSRFSKPYPGDPYVAPSADDALQIGPEIILDNIKGMM